MTVCVHSASIGCRKPAPYAVTAARNRRIFPGQGQWGGWGSNPRPADYESSMLTNARSGFYLPECETDHRYRRRPGRVFAMIMI